MPLGFVVATVPVVNRITEWVLPRSLVAQSLAVVYGDPARVTPELVDRYFELTLREGNRRALAQRLQHRVIGEHAERIASIRQPTLILWGGRDRLIPPAVGRVFEQQIAGSRLVVFDDLGHVPHEEDPARTVAPVKEFLLGLQLASAQRTTSRGRTGRRGSDLADGGRGVEAVAAEDRQHLAHGFRCAGHEQPAAGLRVGQQGLVDGGEAVGQRHLGAVAGPVAARGAGDEALRGELAHAGQQRHAWPSRCAPGNRRRARSPARGRRGRSR